MNRWEVIQLGQKLLAEHGFCRYTDSTISISYILAALNPEHQTRNMILHEIAHARVGSGKGHDREWQAMARQVGAVPKRCYSDDVILPPPKYLRVCPECGPVLGAERRIKGLWSCPRHGKGFRPDLQLSYRLNTERIVP